VDPVRDLSTQLGRQSVFFSDQTIELTADHLAELRGVDSPRITRPERYFLIAATGDEVIDWTAMVSKYAGCRQRVIEGSDHALSDFDRYMNEVLDFCDGLT
ncbi:MAG TPA: YqiA/YcfP family alpha/beta fold hydrolase, partial [Burkholderiaceae bacterium]|nr:YqiA/YcfP family alpha/beta fold hydrolase [Burkholderiaceae bacterium]